MASSDVSTRQSAAVQVTDQRGRTRNDAVAIEEPLEIRIQSGGELRTATVTMRTPGHDPELAAGFLLAENVIDSVEQIAAIRRCGGNNNVVRVELRDGCVPRVTTINRNFAANSSCGLCGRTTLEGIGVTTASAAIDDRVRIDPTMLLELPDRLRDAQSSFQQTGGLHAVAAFTANGDLIRVFEDIGRHNAFDKVIGATAFAGERLSDVVIVLSGRAGYEMVQKAAAVRATIVAAIGAPSSLALQVAEQAGITLIGFLRDDRYNVYTHPQRLHMRGDDHGNGAFA